MIDRLPVELVFPGEPFARAAVVHTLRHLAMRAGWVLCPKAERRLIYCTCLKAAEAAVQGGEIVVLSSPSVKRHLAQGREPIPLGSVPGGEVLPFPHPEAGERPGSAWIRADVIAGAYSVLNLWYEIRTRSREQDGWILFDSDWWRRAGFEDPKPLADQWLDRILRAADQAGWPRTELQSKAGFLGAPFTLVLTHDVDYLPTEKNFGLPRLGRALARQIVSRRRPWDAWRVMMRYLGALPRRRPYFELPLITAEEGERGAHSSFQVTVRRDHPVDPSYDVRRRPIQEALHKLQASGWEVCLHGSYRASRTLGRLAAERRELEQVLGRPVWGHRQHYLNFHPAQLFVELENAGFKYDLSVGYNDRSGPRAGTLFPYRPYHVEAGRPHELWEFPFVLMDTTLATTYRFSASQARDHVLSFLERNRGCVGLIWHQEQLGGLLDPGFDGVYYRALDWAREQGARLVAPGTLLPELEKTWAGTIDREGDSKIAR